MAWLRSLAALLLVCALPGSLPAATYYVSPIGKDTNPGTATLPWKSLHQAAAFVRGGDTVLIRDGVYQGGITLTTPGTADHPIIFQALGSSAIIAGSGGKTDALLISGIDLNPDWWLGGDMYVTIQGLKINNANRAGIRISCAHHVTIRNCLLDHNGRWGIFTDYSNYTLLDGNECRYSQIEHGIYVSNSSDYPTIRRNRVHHNAASGIQINADPAMDDGDGITTGALIEQNLVYENGRNGGAAINLASVRQSQIRHNLLYHNYAGGIAGWGDGNGPAWGCKNDSFINNTIYFRPDEGRWAISLKEGSTGAVIRNNILMGGGRGALEFDDTQITANLKMDYNLLSSAESATVVTWEDTGYYSLSQWKNAYHQDAHSLTGTPAVVFADYSKANFTLKQGSPARNVGDPAAVYLDRNKTRNDLGAFGGPSSMGARYTFRYTYGNGDSYSGRVFGPSDQGYYVGWKRSQKNETAQTGWYEILSLDYTPTAWSAGQVYVDAYQDGESQKTFTPVHKGTAVGQAYLSSELDYLGVDQAAAYKFGQGYYEADVGDKYSFRYSYGNGDYYQGYVYRTPVRVYYPGYIRQKKNELGLTGSYQILSMSYTGETAKYGQVFVNLYRDSESNASYAPLKKGQAVGSNYLGSELDHIIKSSVAAYKFGQGYYEADAL